MAGPRIAPHRLRQRLEQLAIIGRDPEGGITRLPFTPPHQEAVRAVAAMMAEAGLAVGVDEFGILNGRRDGASDRPAILVGSHLDTVPRGGMFDGALGVLAGIECAHALREAGVALRHPLIIVGFADEEGSGFGLGTLSARVLVGLVPRNQFARLHDATGRSLAEHLAARAHGLPVARIPARVRAYLELHLEQGPVLDRKGVLAAAVEAITGTLRTTVTFHGRANHAGTTPMTERADALWGAAEFTLTVRDLARASGPPAVGTVGQLMVAPGVANIVPGRAELRLDLRSPDETRLQALRLQIASRAEEIAAALRLTVEVAAWDHTPAVVLDPRVRASIIHALETCGQAPLVLESWAGHDAGIIAQYAPAGMIFVATTGGISHAPDEHAPWPAVEVGAQVLLETLLALDASDHAGEMIPLAYESEQRLA